MEDVSFDNIIDVVAAEHIPIIVLKLMKCTEYPVSVHDLPCSIKKMV